MRTAQSDLRLVESVTDLAPLPEPTPGTNVTTVQSSNSVRMALLHCAISSLRRPRSPWTRPARGCGCRLGTERSPAQRGAAEGAGATIGGATIVAANVMGVGAAAMIGGAKRGDAGAMTSAAVTTVAETTTAAATAVMTEGGAGTTLKGVLHRRQSKW